MIKRGLSLGVIMALLQISPSVEANSVLNLSDTHAQGSTGSIPSVTIWPGMGLSLNFSGTGEHIIKAWLDDPSRLTLDFDTPLCGSDFNNGCGSTTIIHLRRIHPLKFSHIPSTATTLLTVVTSSGSERKIYYFLVGYGSGQAKYVAVNINRDPRPILQQRQNQEQATRARVNRIEQGLIVARGRDTSQRNGQVFQRVEILLAHVRGGMSFNDALRRTNLAPSVLEQLEALARISD